MDDSIVIAGVRLFDDVADPAAVFDVPVGGPPWLARVNRSLARLVTEEHADDQVRERLLAPFVEVDTLAPLAHNAVATGREQTVHRYAELPSQRVDLDVRVLPLGRNRALVTARDLSAPRSSLRALRRLERATQAGIFSWDPLALRLSLSAQSRRLLGLPLTRHVTAETILDTVHPADRAGITRAFTEDTSEPDLRFRVLRPDGEVRVLRCWGHRVVDHDGHLVRLSGGVQDLTALRDMERRQQDLRQATDEHRRALELNDDVLQRLARMWIALELGDEERARAALAEALTHLQAIMNDLVATTRRMHGGLRPGDLARGVRSERGAHR